MLYVASNTSACIGVLRVNWRDHTKSGSCPVYLTFVPSPTPEAFSRTHPKTFAIAYYRPLLLHATQASVPRIYAPSLA